MTIREFIKTHGVKMSAVRVDANPHMQTGDDWSLTASHWRCRLRSNIQKRFAMRVYFSMGSAHRNPPTAADVLDSLASDSVGVDGQSLEDWAAEYGYDTDSRKALRTFKVCKRQSAKLRQLLGDVAYSQLINDVERL